MASFVSDLRYAVRLFAKTPAFTGVAILTIALGIGANTAVFSLLNAVFLRPLPFPEPGRLVMVWEDTAMFKLRFSPPSVANYVDWRAQNRVFDEMGAWEHTAVTLSGGGEPEQVRGIVATSSVLRTLRVGPAIGRSFEESEDRPGAGKVAIVSFGLWQRRLGGRPDLAGATLRIDGLTCPVVGVLPRGFQFPDAETEIWIPAGAAYSEKQLTHRGWHNHSVVARLKPGIGIQQANEDIRTIAKRLEAAYPRTNDKIGAFVTPMREHLTGDTRRLVPLLLSAVGLVLLIACANVANLLLSRAMVRRREIAVRMSLGAGGWQIARQFVVEHLLLAASGTAAGLLMAAWSFDLLQSLVPASLRGMTELALDGRVLGFSAILCVVSALIFGVAPIAHMLRMDAQPALKGGDERSGRSRESGRVRDALVVAQVALTLVLLAAAGLLMRTFATLRAVDPGIRTENLLVMRLMPRGEKYREADARHRFYEQILARIQSLPGVVSAAGTTGVPLSFKGFFVGFQLEGEQRGDTVNYRVITPDYFRTVGMPLREGRNLTEADREDTPAVGIVNETLARKYWPGQDAIGRRFIHGNSGGNPTTVVGVVADVRQAGLDVPPRPEIYLPYRQQASYPSELAVRTAVDPKSLIAAIRREIAQVDPEQPVTGVRTLEDVLDRETAPQKTRMVLFGSFALLALALASVGVYGVLSFAVTQRTQEIGIRMALGAQPPAILRAVLLEGARLLGVGAAIGLALSLAVTRLMSHLLFGVGAADPLTFTAAAVVLFGVGAAAACTPARRAMRIDPVRALREG